jgi:guanylate kinase
VGKSFAVEYLCKKRDFKTIAPYTTRAPRHSELDGVHYKFRKEREIAAISDNFQRGYWARPMGGHLYGYTTELDCLGSQAAKWVIPAYSDIAVALKHRHPEVVILFLDFETDECMDRRWKERFGAQEIEHRKRHADHERASRHLFDYVVVSDNLNDIVQNIFTLSESRNV